MKAPGLVEVIAKVITDNSVIIHDECDYGDMTASTLTPEEMGRAVLAVLGEAGNVEWGVENGHTPIDYVTVLDTEDAAIAEMHDRRAIGIPSRVVSRPTFPWTAVE